MGTTTGTWNTPQYRTLGVRADGTVIGTDLEAVPGLSTITNWTDIIAVAGGAGSELKVDSVTHQVFGLRADGTVAAATDGDDLAGAGNVGDWTDIVAIAARYASTVGLKADGTLRAAGVVARRFEEPVANWTGIVSIALGHHLVGLKADGTVVASGENTYGECDVGGWSDIVAITADSESTVGLRADGTVVYAGSNSVGQGNVSDWTDIVAISVGFGHTVGLRADGNVVATGLNNYGQCDTSAWRLGPGLEPPIFVAFPVNSAAIIGGPAWFHARALAVGNIDYQWFRNGIPLVDDARIHGSTSETLRIDNAQAIDRGGYTVMASNSSGSVTSDPAKLETMAMPPHQIPNVAGNSRYTAGLRSDGMLVVKGSASWLGGEGDSWSHLVAVAAGWDHTVGLRLDGTVVAAGDRLDGQREVTDWTGVIQVAAGWYGTLGLRADGTVLVVHRDDAFKAQIATWSNIVAIATGDEDHAVGLRADGTVVAAGSNKYGRCDVADWRDIVAVAAGEFHTVGLKADGTVLAVGQYDDSLPCDVREWSDIVAIDADPNHTVGLKADGTVVVDPSNVDYNPSFDYYQPDVTAWTGIIAVAAGYDHIVGLKAEGTVLAVGRNDDGECETSDWNLGGGARQGGHVTVWGPYSIIYPVNGYGARMTKIAAKGHNLALTQDRRVVAWGSNNTGESEVPAGLTDVIDIAVGGDHSLALREGGTVVAWGNNNFGQCDVPPGLHDVVAIAAGGECSLALSQDGTVTGWGNGILPIERDDIVAISSGVGLAADGTVIGLSSPFYDLPEGLNNVIAVASSDGWPKHIIVLRADGTVRNWKGVLGGYAEVEVPDGLTGVTAIAAGEHSLALRQDGTVIAWPVPVIGPSSCPACPVFEGLTGVIAIAGNVALKADGTVIGSGPSPQGLSGIAAIAAGSVHYVALATGGTVHAWGNNDFGQCEVPEGLDDAVAIVANYYNSMALRADGTIVEWGPRGWGYVSPPELSGVAAIALGADSHRLALRSDGTVVEWGAPAGVHVPDGLSEVVAIALGGRADEGRGSPPEQHYGLALKADGTVIGWGDNAYGQIAVPVGLTGVVAIAARGVVSLAVLADGTVAAWGDNSYGQCDVPADLDEVLMVAIGERHCLALKANGEIVTWGEFEADIPAGLTDVVSVAASGYQSMALFGRENSAPVAASYRMATFRDIPKSMPLFKLHRACRDPDWDAFIITAVSPNTSRGGLAEILGNTILYTPPANFVGDDTFSYTVRDSRGASSLGVVQVAVNDSAGANIISVTLGPSGAATIHCAGIPGLTYAVETSPDLVHWSIVGSSIAGATGLFDYVDELAPSHSTRYYRTCYGPAAGQSD